MGKFVTYPYTAVVGTACADSAENGRVLYDNTVYSSCTHTGMSRRALMRSLHSCTTLQSSSKVLLLLISMPSLPLADEACARPRTAPSTRTLPSLVGRHVCQNRAVEFATCGRTAVGGTTTVPSPVSRWFVGILGVLHKLCRHRRPVHCVLHEQESIGQAKASAVLHTLHRISSLVSALCPVMSCGNRHVSNRMWRDHSDV